MARIICLVLVSCFVVSLLVGCGGVSGPEIEVQDVWSRPAMMDMGSGESSEGGMGMAGTGAVFMLIKNSGSEADRLLGGQTSVAEVVEIHETVIENEVMKMQMLSDGLEIPASGQVVLKPGSYHVMLIGMKQNLEVGDSFTLDLEFEKTGTKTVQPEVRMP